MGRKKKEVIENNVLLPKFNIDISKIEEEEKKEMMLMSIDDESISTLSNKYIDQETQKIIQRKKMVDIEFLNKTMNDGKKILDMGLDPDIFQPFYDRLKSGDINSIKELECFLKAICNCQKYQNTIMENIAYDYKKPSSSDKFLIRQTFKAADGSVSTAEMGISIGK